MKPKCIDAVNQAAAAMGRSRLTESQINDIDSRLRSTMRRLARTDDAWQAKSADQRLSDAATQAMADIKAEAQRKVQNAQLQIVKTAATEERIQRFMEQNRPSGGKPSRSRALVDEMNETRTLADAEKVMALGRMHELLAAAKTGRGASAGRRLAMFLFDAENPHMTRDLVNEIFAKGEAGTGNEVARLGSQAWLRVIEEQRQRFNAAGGDIRKLAEHGYLPQPHEPGRVYAAGASTYVAKVMGLLDRSQYLREDGARMTDAEVADILAQAWETIGSEGLNKQVPGAVVGSGSRANKGSEARVIHFKDGNAWMAYMSEFGRGNMYDAMIAHLGGITRDITLVERYGPNPNAQMRLQFDLAARADGGKLEKVGVGLGMFRIDARGAWQVLSGAASTPASDMAALAAQTVRNLQSAAKLGATVIKSFPDVASYFITTGFNRLPYWEATKNLWRVAADPEIRQFLGMHGLMANSAIEALNRHSADNIRQTWSGQLANSTMRLQLANAWDDWLTRAWGMTKMNGLANMATKPWERLTQWDRALLERRGIAADDWSVINTAGLHELQGMKFLTPDSIIETGHERALEIATKILALVRDETQYAVVKPDLETQTARTWNGTQAGTGLGELARSVMLFKSFPFAMVSRHFRRLKEMPQVTDGSAPFIVGNRVGYMGALIATGTVMGAISNQAWQILQGKDPVDMSPTGPHALKFWAQAVATGGGLGFYGDLFLRDSSEDRGAWDTIGKTLGGPVVGDVADLYSLTKGNIDQALAGKRTHSGAEAVRFVRSHLPLVNLWYGKAVLDHAALNALQENLSPGYLEKMRQRASRDWGQRYWWAPGSDLPERAPDLPAAVGR